MNELLATLLFCALPFVAVAGRMHGIGRIKHLRAFSYLFLGAGLLLSGVIFHGWFWGVAQAAFGLWAFSWGHGNFYHMKGAGPINDEPELMERLGVRALWQEVFGRTAIFTPAYSWWCMGLKWLCVTWALGPIGILAAVACPAFYAYSFRRINSTDIAEWCTTSFTAFLLAIIAYGALNG